MTKEKPQLENVERSETRKFSYSNEVSNLNFEFEIDVSSPERALAEISDFRDLMAQSFNDLELLGKEFASSIEKPKKEEIKKEEKSSGKKIEDVPIVTASK